MGGARSRAPHRFLRWMFLWVASQPPRRHVLPGQTASASAPHHPIRWCCQWHTLRSGGMPAPGDHAPLQSAARAPPRIRTGNLPVLSGTPLPVGPEGHSTRRITARVLPCLPVKLHSSSSGLNGRGSGIRTRGDRNPALGHDPGGLTECTGPPPALGLSANPSRALGRIRTDDLRLRRATRYPLRYKDLMIWWP